MSWGYWEYYKPAKPKKVKNGIRAKSQRGVIGETWWSKRWIDTLDSFNLSSRLSRGRSYARKGQVISINVTKGEVVAKVQGTRKKPYDVEIKLNVLPDKKWDKVTDVMASKAIFVAKLLAGEMPLDIEDAFKNAGTTLFPKNEKELNTSCSCPDWANPCKHIAAVYYLLAERFDENPFLIFKLRGKTKKAVINRLREKRCVTEEDDKKIASEKTDLGGRERKKLEECLDHFWHIGKEIESFSLNPAPPEVQNAILKRLGDAPFHIGKSNVASLLEKGYDIVSKVALQKAYTELQDSSHIIEENKGEKIK